MNARSRFLISVICVLVLASLACRFGPLWFGDSRPDPYDESGMDFDFEDPIFSSATATSQAVATRQPRVTVEVEQKPTGVCSWEVYEVTYPAETTSNPKMEISTSATSVTTNLYHGISGCEEQIFFTHHDWTIPTVAFPGRSYELKVEFSWQNDGTPDCSNLIAGGVTTLTIGDVRLRVENMSINVKTHSEGKLTDSITWIAPQGEVGDTFTFVAHASSGSYGTNARYHFKYVCN